MSRWVLALVFGLGGLLAFAGELRADDACDPLADRADRADRADAGTAADGGDCTPVEQVPGLDCPDASFDVTVWVAGLRGLCDAPFGLGIPRIAVRLLLVARVAGAPQGQPRPIPADHRAARLQRHDGPSSLPPPVSHADGDAGRDLALVDAVRRSLASVRRGPPAPALLGTPRPGFARRLDRPPRAV